VKDFPLPPKEEKQTHDGELTAHEFGFILDTCLKKRHRKDALVISFIDSFVRCKHVGEASAEVGIHPAEGYKWRHRKDIANAIQKITDKSAVKHGMDGTEIFERAKEIVDFDPIDVQNPDGTWKDNLNDIPPSARRNIKKIKCKNLYQQTEDLNGMKSKIIVGKAIEYEFYDKLKGIELTGKEKEMFKNTTRVEHTVTKDMAEILLASKQRADKLIENKPPVTIEAEVLKKE